ncbi:MAG: hypothetical protein V3T37_07285, partial [Syntrophobacteria bacterium]
GEAAKQRAPEPPVFTHLSLARASMKIWCIFKGDTAIKWRELLVVDEPSPLACVAHNILRETPGGTKTPLQYSIPPRQQGWEFSEERRGFRPCRVSMNHYWYGFCCYLHVTMNNHWACDVE